MNALAKHLAVGLDVRCNSLAFGISRSDGGWRVTLDDATTHDADALVLTCPLPQTFSLLVSAEVQMPEALWRTDYERTLSLLAVLDRPSAVTGAGGVQHDPNFTFVGDNQRKGISDVPAVTCHAKPEWSAAHWDDDPADAHAALIELARPWLGEAVIVESQLKRWRFATPMSIWPERCWQPDGVDSLAVAGDAFAGPRVEGAILSGLAAGRAVTEAAR
jgi:predicted NAD/FAD-dependent oxidoreductase